MQSASLCKLQQYKGLLYISQIYMSTKKKIAAPDKASQVKIVKGKLDISRSGMGFVIVEGEEKDIMIKPHDFGKAFHGDMVRVQIPKPNGARGRVEGKVIDVAERKQTEFIGNIEIHKAIAFFIAGGEKTLPDFFFPTEKLGGAVHGDRVIAKFIKWDKNDKKPQAEIISVIKSEDEADLSMKEIILNAGFPLAFDAEVHKAAEALSEKITRVEEKKRKDCRDILTFTIDPFHAKDFDDALSIRNLDNGAYEIGVHIADVSHFVEQGSILDKAAYARATSVYLPDRVNPMLPERISNELCSLRPKEDKYTFSVIFQITNRAEIKHTWIGRTIIHSDTRFTYEQVQEIIEAKEGEHSKAILLLNSLAQNFRAERFKNGAINFSSSEVKFQLDEHGNPIGIVVKESKDSHKLVEEFMLLANRAVAEYVSKIKINKEPMPFPYRIHDTPDDEKLKPFVAFAKKFGYTFDMSDEAAVAASFNQLLASVQGKPEQHVLEQLGIRTMAKAVYTSENVGHYGLGFEHYCHFTSPIRRYPDVMAHRILQQCLEKNLQPDKKMEEKCKHCSDRERAAMEAERAANKYKQVQYMQQFVGDDFDAVISGVSAFGFWAETVLHKCEGLVSVRDLSDFDDFKHDEAAYALIGLRTGTSFRIGDKVTIKVISANLTKRQLDYQWVTEKKAGAASSAKNTGKKSSAKQADSKTTKRKKV